MFSENNHNWWNGGFHLIIHWTFHTHQYTWISITPLSHKLFAHLQVCSHCPWGIGQGLATTPHSETVVTMLGRVYTWNVWFCLLLLFLIVPSFTCQRNILWCKFGWWRNHTNRDNWSLREDHSSLMGSYQWCSKSAGGSCMTKKWTPTLQCACRKGKRDRKNA